MNQYDAAVSLAFHLEGCESFKLAQAASELEGRQAKKGTFWWNRRGGYVWVIYISRNLSVKHHGQGEVKVRYLNGPRRGEMETLYSTEVEMWWAYWGDTL